MDKPRDCIVHRGQHHVCEFTKRMDIAEEKDTFMQEFKVEILELLHNNASINYIAEVVEEWRKSWDLLLDPKFRERIYNQVVENND